MSAQITEIIYNTAVAVILWINHRLFQVLLPWAGSSGGVTLLVVEAPGSVKRQGRQRLHGLEQQQRTLLAIVFETKG